MLIAVVLVLALTIINGKILGPTETGSKKFQHSLFNKKRIKERRNSKYYIMII